MTGLNDEMTPAEFLYILSDRVRYVNHRKGALKFGNDRFLAVKLPGKLNAANFDSRVTSRFMQIKELPSPEYRREVWEDGAMFDIEINALFQDEREQDITLVHEIYHIRDDFMYVDSSSGRKSDEDLIEEKAVKFYEKYTDLVKTEAELSKMLRQDGDDLLVKA